MSLSLLQRHVMIRRGSYEVLKLNYVMMLIGSYKDVFCIPSKFPTTISDLIAMGMGREEQRMSFASVFWIGL